MGEKRIIGLHCSWLINIHHKLYLLHVVTVKCTYFPSKCRVLSVGDKNIHHKLYLLHVVTVKCTYFPSKCRVLSVETKRTEIASMFFIFITYILWKKCKQTFHTYAQILNSHGLVFFLQLQILKILFLLKWILTWNFIAWDLESLEKAMEFLRFYIIVKFYI